MNNYIAGIETETVFDRRPSHAARPSWVTDAQDIARAAWQIHDEAVDAYLAGKVDHETMRVAGEQAQAAQEFADDMLFAWQNGYIPAGIPENVSIDITVSVPL